MGSGSTGKAARMEGFNFVGIETDQRFFQIAMERCGADNGSDFETALADLMAAVQRNKEARENANVRC
jgi:DNA modification methylase